MGKGRKRKAAPREANGRAQRETAWQVKLPVLERRCNELGWRLTHENLRQVDKFGGTVWGMMLLAGDIDRRQFEAMEWFATVRANYLRAIDAPPDTPRGASYGGATGASLIAENEDRARMARRAYEGAVRALRFRRHHYALVALANEQRVEIKFVKPALRRIADHALVAEE